MALVTVGLSARNKAKESNKKILNLLNYKLKNAVSLQSSKFNHCNIKWYLLGTSFLVKVYNISWFHRKVIIILT